jgi:hypothetical protein
MFKPRSTFLAMTLPLVLSTPMMANDTELGLSIGAGNPDQKNLNLSNGTLISSTGTSITTQFSGPWKLAGIDLARELVRGEKMSFWVRAGYTTALGNLDYAKDGQDSPVAFEYNSEVINGTVSYSNYTYGLGLSFTTNKVGEYGISVDRRTHHTKLSGTLTQINIPGTNSTSGYSLSTTDSDYLVTLSMTFVQAHPTFKTFQRISYGFSFGGDSGDVQADHQGYLMNSAYLVRTHPSQELRFGYGFRL